MNGYEYIASILKSEGIKWMACFPSNPLIEAVASCGIRPVMFRHERGAVMAADGFTRSSDENIFGVVAVQSQAGAENSIGGLAQAFADNIPILFFPGGNSLNNLNIRPNFSAVRTYQSVAKNVESILSPNQVGDVMRRAFHGLRNGPPGPMVVELISDVCSMEVSESDKTYSSPPIAKQVPDIQDIKAASSVLTSAKRPLIWCGSGVLSSHATKEVVRLSELISAPVYCTMPGKSGFPENHKLFLGSGSGTTTLAAHQWLTTCDTVLAVGTSLTRSPYAQPFPKNPVVIHNTINHHDLNKEERADIGLLGDTKLTIKSLINQLKDYSPDQNHSARLVKKISETHHLWRSLWEPVVTDDTAPLNYYRVIGALNSILKKNSSIVTHDAGAPRDCMVPFYQATVPKSYIGWGKTTHLGFGIPLMIGAKVANPNKFCLNVMGDAAFGMSGIDIETSVRANLPITTIVLNNKGMATYSGFTESLVGPEARKYGVTKSSGCYAELASSLGAKGIKIKTATALDEAITTAIELNAIGTTVLIEVETLVEERRSSLKTNFKP